MVLELKIFKLSPYRYNLPLKKKRVLHWTQMNFLYQRLPCYKCSSNSLVSSHDVVTSLCSCSFVIEARKGFVHVNGGTDAAWDEQ